ncbi:hypothetical protein [Granulicella arctica]|uniref:Uncharacterized protein n=1 Tax=Granulicella arctica TaxID=940613 RepID=A0A7Y9PI78_9BACT|nr:hypothetical protein [Granulicella arctica]NYF80374.1 hypothetical protein [Granulicella arctica]
MRTIQAAALTIILLGSGTPFLAQQGATLPSVRAPFGPGNSTDTNPLSPAAQEQMERSRQTDRQKKLIADTNRLLTLATELKTDMDKTSKDTMSLDVIKKAEEIEKLAHSVKERMKG